MAALWDLRTGEIPDYITVPGVAVSFVYSILYSPVGLINMVLFGSLGYLLYRFGVVGGGDVLLLLSLTPFLPEVPFVHFAVLFVSMALTTAAYGVILKSRENALYVLPLAVLPPVLLLLYGTLLMALVPKSYFKRKVAVEELREEDVLASVPEGFSKRVIERGDREKLRSMGIREVEVLVNLPRMGPFIFLVLLFIEVSPDPSLLFTPPVLALYLLF